VSALATFHANEAEQAAALGAEPIYVPCEGAGTGILENLRYFARMVLQLRRLQPDLVHNFSIKPMIWGTLAAKAVGVPAIVCTVTGAGALRRGPPVVRQVIRGLYRYSLAGRTVAIFQNREDRDLFVNAGLIDRGRAVHVPGCGVDIDRLTPNFDRSRKRRFVMASRMLWSKGVREFIEAARIIKRGSPDVECILLGGGRSDYGSKNPDFVSDAYLLEAQRRGDVAWHGRVPADRVEELMRDATAVVLLSSYAEGVPRSLIEAAALGAPIITMDAPGCRDVVGESVSGFLCRPGNAVDDAVQAMKRLLDEPELADRMGPRGRALAMRFSAERVMSETARIYADLLSDRGSAHAIEEHSRG
jgi:glycosyltransferase involved in cell wall biosynthesis